MTSLTLAELIAQRNWRAVIEQTDLHKDSLDVDSVVFRARALIHSGRLDDALSTLSPRADSDDNVRYWRDVCLCAIAQPNAVEFDAVATASTVGAVGSALVALVAAFLRSDLSRARNIIAAIESSWPRTVLEATADPLKPHWVFFELIRAVLMTLGTAIDRTGQQQRVFVFGDSHIVSQAHREVRFPHGRVGCLEPMLVCSLEAWHLSHRCHPTAQRASAERHAALVDESAITLFVCGEIDTRQNTGIDRATKSGHYADEQAAIDATASDYVDWLAAHVRGRIFVQAVRPTREIRRVGRCETINARIRQFNSAVARRIAALANPRLTFLPVPNLTAPSGYLAPEYFIETDTFHMNERCVDAIQESLNDQQQ
jgi:hypothetical protein